VIRQCITENFIATGDAKGQLSIWSKRTFQLLNSHCAHEFAVMDIGLSDQWIASAGKDGGVKLWSTKTGDYLKEVRESEAAACTRAGVCGFLFAMVVSGNCVVIGTWHGDHPAVEVYFTHLTKA
jgi:WD40 repeat protein